MLLRLEQYYCCCRHKSTTIAAAAAAAMEQADAAATQLLLIIHSIANVALVIELQLVKCFEHTDCLSQAADASWLRQQRVTTFSVVLFMCSISPAHVCAFVGVCVENERRLVSFSVLMLAPGF